jgi:EmrB/QacA subfamily drug resistance transporter
VVTAPTRSRWIIGAVSTALFCVQIDYFAINLALPRMSSDLNTTTTDLQWVISIYMLVLGAFMAPAGRIGDIFGRRRMLMIGIAIFGAASVGCAMAPTAAVVIAFRAMQGLGAALIFPVSVSVLTNSLAPERAGRAIGLAYGIAGLGNAAGPLVGGLLTETLGWRAIFWMLVPMAAVSLVVGLRAIPETRDASAPRRVDVGGLALIISGIGLFTLAFDRAPTSGWLSAATVGAFVGSIALLSAFFAVERRVRFPLIDLSLLRNARFTLLVIAGTIANIAYVVTIFLSTMNLQQVRGLSPVMAGLAFLGPSAGAALGGPVSGRLASRNAPFAVMGIGCAVAAISLAALAATDNLVGYLVALTACGFSMGLVYAFTTVATQSVVAPERAGEAAGVTLTSLVTLAGVGVAVSGTVLEVLQHNGLTTGDGITIILGVVAAVLLPAGLAAASLARRSNRR